MAHEVVLIPGDGTGPELAEATRRVLDATGNLKAVQKLLGHSSIQTTGDVYADWDIDQLAQTMADVLSHDDEDAA